MFQRRRIDMNPPPPLPKMECPVRIQQLVPLGLNILLRTEEIQECKTTPPKMTAGWCIKGTAFYKVPKNATKVLIERSVEPDSRNAFTVSYSRYVGKHEIKYKEPVRRSWTSSGLDEYARRYLIRYEIVNIVPDFKKEF